MSGAYHSPMAQPPFPTPEVAADPDAPSQMLEGPAGAIEAAVEYPEGAARPVVAVLCHPLPTEGGPMHNKVVTMAARALRKCGATTVRFNFRGVGDSEGAFDDGRGELEDLRTVVAWVREQRPEHQLWLCGFSFGAYVSLRGAVELAADAVISIAPPVGRSWDFKAIVPPTCPWLVVQGEDDEIVDPQAVYAWAATMPRPPEVVRMAGASHFFHRKLIDLRGAVRNGVRTWLPQGARADG